MDWNQNLSVGIPSIDEQHRQLLNVFTELQGAMRDGKGSAKVIPTLRFLEDYALKHFATEEALMRMHAYPGFDEHRKEHDAFRADFARILQETEATQHRVAKTMEVSRRILEWLLRHINKVDRRMGEYLAARSVR